MLVKLPEGNHGIASRYLNDADIGTDPAVVLADSFESGLGKWDHTWGPDTGGVLKIVDDPDKVFNGGCALECTALRPSAVRSNAGVHSHFKNGFDLLFVRYYAKYKADAEIFHGGTHNGLSIFARAPGVPDAKPGIRADGVSDYSALLDTWRGPREVPSPGHLCIYCYHPEQNDRFGDHFYSDGKILNAKDKYGHGLFGSEFTPRPVVIPQLDRWHCYELMVQANTPGQRDGRIAFWFDGELAGDFPNLRLRDVATLKANCIGFIMYTMNSKMDRTATIWYDDVVAATSYVGPMLREEKTVASTTLANSGARA